MEGVLEKKNDSIIKAFQFLHQCCIDYGHNDYLTHKTFHNMHLAIHAILQISSFKVKNFP
jgi:hypothetical protein